MLLVRVASNIQMVQSSGFSNDSVRYAEIKFKFLLDQKTCSLFKCSGRQVVVTSINVGTELETTSDARQNGRKACYDKHSSARN